MSEKALPTAVGFDRPASKVAERWRKWKRAFEYFEEDLFTLTLQWHGCTGYL